MSVGSKHKELSPNPPELQMATDFKHFDLFHREDSRVKEHCLLHLQN